MCWVSVGYIYCRWRIWGSYCVCVCANTFIDTSTPNLANVLSCNHHSQQVDFNLAFWLRIDSYSLASQTKVKSIQKTSAELGTTSTIALPKHQTSHQPWASCEWPDFVPGRAARSCCRGATLLSAGWPAEPATATRTCWIPMGWPSSSLGLKASHDPKFHGISSWVRLQPPKKCWYPPLSGFRQTRIFHIVKYCWFYAIITPL